MSDVMSMRYVIFGFGCGMSLVLGMMFLTIIKVPGILHMLIWSAVIAIDVGLVVGGPHVRFPPVFSESKKTNGLKFHVTRCFDSRESGKKVTCYLPLPHHNGAPPSPPVCTQDPLLCMGINKKANSRACHLPWGVPYCWPFY